MVLTSSIASISSPHSTLNNTNHSTPHSTPSSNIRGTSKGTPAVLPEVFKTALLSVFPTCHNNSRGTLKNTPRPPPWSAQDNTDTGLLDHFHFTFRGLYCEDILWILIFTRQHGLTRFTCFYGTHRKFYFCVRCSHTLCPLTRINIEGHNALYLTS